MVFKAPPSCKLLSHDDPTFVSGLERGVVGFRILIYMRFLEPVLLLFHMCGHRSVLRKSHKRVFCLVVNGIMLLGVAFRDRVKMGL